MPNQNSMKKYVITLSESMVQNHSVRISIVSLGSTRPNLPKSLIIKKLFARKSKPMDALKKLNVLGVYVRCGNSVISLQNKRMVMSLDTLRTTLQAIVGFPNCLRCYQNLVPTTLTSLARLSSKAMWRNLYNRETGQLSEEFWFKILLGLYTIIPFQGRISLDISPSLESQLFRLMIASNKYLNVIRSCHASENQ